MVLVSLKVQEGNIIWPKTLRMLKFHPITAFMKMHANFQKIFLIRVFGLNIYFQLNIKFAFYKFRFNVIVLSRKSIISLCDLDMQWTMTI